VVKSSSGGGSTVRGEKTLKQFPRRGSGKESFWAEVGALMPRKNGEK